MFTYCAYTDCMKMNRPYSKTTFFNLPKDHRRQIWIENSGNRQLRELSSTSVRFFCESHFDPKYFKRQFNRTILHKTAVPYKYNANKLTESAFKEENFMNNRQPSTSIQMADIQYPKSDIEEENIEVALQDANEDEFIEVIEKDFSSENEHIEDNLQTNNSPENINTDPQFAEEYDFIEDEKNFSEEVTKQNSSSWEKYEPNKNISQAPDKNNRRANSETVAFANSRQENNTTSYTEDEHFALSLVGYFQRLPHKQKAIAKLKILKYLTELECENYANE